jgi:uncharacterized protein (TIRG00374 family)
MLRSIINAMKFRQLLVILGIGALGVLLMANLGRLSQFWQLLGHIRWYILLFVIVVQLVGYYCNAKYYQAYLKLFGFKTRLKALFHISLALNFVNQAFPTGGVAGASFLTTQLVKEDVPAGKGTLAQVIRYAFTFLSYLIILLMGFLFLFLGGNLQLLSARVILLFIIAIIIISAMVLLIVSDRSKIEVVVEGAIRVLNRIVRFFRRDKTALVKLQNVRIFFDEFYQGYDFLKQNTRKWRPMLLWCLGGNISEVLTVYVVCLAFSASINLGAVVAAYTLANIFSFVSPITGGAGVYEATMIGTFVSLGVPFTLAFGVVLVYRIFNMTAFLPVGFYFFRKRV